MDKKDTTRKLRWHPAFLQAVRHELFDYRYSLEFNEEYNLTAAPLNIDLLIIKKPKELTIDKNIARLFRTDNILEYKSPEDYLSVKDFWKVCAYANLYAAITPGVELADITLTFVGSRHPRKLLEYLTGVRGYTVEESAPGIYQIMGDYLPIQVIESRKLPKKENLWLNSLRDGLEKSTARAIVRAIVEEGKKRGDEVPLDAYMDVVVRANPRIFMEVQTMAKKKRETFEEVFTKAGLIPEWMERGRVQSTFEFARKMKARAYPLAEITEVTGLPMETIEKL